MHELHKAVGDALRSIDYPGMQVLLDSACGGVGRHIRLYGDEQIGSGSCLVWVDAALVVNDEIRVLVEIEFSNVRPLYLCGKVFASTLCNYYSRRKQTIDLADSVIFVQMIQQFTSESKRQQCEYLVKEINLVLESLESRVRPYVFHYGPHESFAVGKSDADDLRNEILNFLAEGTAAAPQLTA